MNGRFESYSSRTNGESTSAGLTVTANLSIVRFIVSGIGLNTSENMIRLIVFQKQVLMMLIDALVAIVHVVETTIYAALTILAALLTLVIAAAIAAWRLK